MMRPIILVFLVAIAMAKGENVAGSEAAREGYSQQYHYSAHPGGGSYAGLSFDLSTGLAVAVGAIIILLAVAALMGGHGGGHGGWGAASNYGTYRNINVANLSEKVLNGIEKLYDVYQKNQ